MKYLSWLLVCLLLVSCETATIQPTPMPTNIPMIENAIEEAAKIMPESTQMRNLAIQEVPGLKLDRLFVFLFEIPKGLVIGKLSGSHDATKEQFQSKSYSLYAIDQTNELFVYQEPVQDEAFYVIYGYMPSQKDRVAKIFLKNGQILYFPAGSGLQSRLLPLANPAVKAEILDNTGRVIMEYELYSQ